MYESPRATQWYASGHLKQSIDPGAAIQVEDDRTGTTVETLKRALDNLITPREG